MRLGSEGLEQALYASAVGAVGSGEDRQRVLGYDRLDASVGCRGHTGAFAASLLRCACVCVCVQTTSRVFFKFCGVLRVQLKPRQSKLSISAGGKNHLIFSVKFKQILHILDNFACCAGSPKPRSSAAGKNCPEYG